VTTNRNWGTPNWGITSATTYPFLYFPTTGIYMINWNMGIGSQNIGGFINYNPDFVNNFGNLPQDSSLVGCTYISNANTNYITVTALVNIVNQYDYITLCLFNYSNNVISLPTSTGNGTNCLLSIAKVG
jgi:hypothetical protein